MMEIDYEKIERLLYEYVDPFEVPGALEAIKEALRSVDPADIVRCGDCKWFFDNDCLHTQGLVVPFGHCYCSYGERRDDDQH